jgi:hypothetical protein
MGSEVQDRGLNLLSEFLQFGSAIFFAQPGVLLQRIIQS